MKIANTFSTPLLTMASIQPFLTELLELLTSSILLGTTTSKTNLVKPATSALFNLSRLSLEESISPNEDEIISVLVALVEALKTVLEREPQEKELQRLLVVCIGGFIVLGRDSATVRDVFGGVDAGEVIGRVEGDISKEVIGLVEVR
jgi:PUL domain